MDHFLPSTKNKELYFKLLGTPTVYYKNNPIKISRTTVRVLGYYLACYHHPVSRGDLLLVFWPEETAEKGSRTLRETLSKLRSSIKDKSLLVSETDQLFFDPQKTGSDVIDFLNLADESINESNRYSGTTVLPNKLVEKMKTAINLWHGHSFLNSSKLPTNQNFDQWLMEMQSELDRKKGLLLERLIENFVQTNQIRSAIPYIDQLITSENFNFNFHHKVLNALIGNQQITVAKSYCHLLEEMADARFIDLDNSILSDLIQEVKTEKEIFKTKNENRWQQMFDYHLSYVGHETLLHQIEDKVNQTGIFFIYGEEGIGRSRFMYEAYLRIFNNYQPVQIECHQQYEKLPYINFHSILSELINDRELIPETKQLISHIPFLMQEMIVKYKDIPDTINLPPAGQYQQMLDAILKILENIAKTKKLCFVFDDIQFCDNASLSILSHLIENNFFPKYGVLLTTSNAQFFNSSKATILGFSPHDYFFHELKPITNEEFSLLVEQLIGKPLSLNVIAEINRITQHNTLLGLNIIPSVVENKAFDPDNLEEAIFSEAKSYPEWFENRFLQLSPDAQIVLKYCSLLGNHIRLHQLETIPSLADINLADALEELETFHLLMPERKKETYPGYRFRHSVLKSEVEKFISIARKRMISLEIINSFKDFFPNSKDSQAAIYASLYEEAGEKFLAFDSYLIAAKNASQNFAPEDSMALFQQAENILAQLLDVVTDQHIYRLYYPWILFAIDYNRISFAKEKTNILMQLGKTRKSNFLMGVATYFEGTTGSVFQANSQQSLKKFEKALDLLKGHENNREYIASQLEKARILYTHNEGEPARQICISVLNTIDEISESAGDFSSLKEFARYHLAQIYAGQSNLELAQQILNDIDVTMINSNVLSYLNLKNLHAWVALYTGHLKAAEEMLLNIIILAKRINNEIMLCQAYGTMARFQRLSGNFDLALENLEACYAIAEKFNLTNTGTMAHLSEVAVFLGIGAYQDADKALQEALAISNSNPNPTTVNACASYLGTIEGISGNHKLGLNMLNATLIDMQSVGANYQYLQTRVYYLTIAAHNPQQDLPYPLIEVELAELIDEFHEKGLIIFQLEALLTLALVQYKQANLSSAINTLHKAIGLAIDTNNIFLEFQAYRSLTQISSEIPLPTKERIIYLAEIIQSNGENPKIAKHIEKYCQEVLKKL